MEWDKVAFDRWLTTEPEEEDVNIINELTAENAKLRDEAQDWFKRYQDAVGENDKLKQRMADVNSKNAGISKLLRRKESYAIDVKIEFDEALKRERAHVAKLQSQNAKLREQLAEAMSIIEYIDKHAPLADDTCDEPGITLSEAARRAIADNAD